MRRRRGCEDRIPLPPLAQAIFELTALTPRSELRCRFVGESRLAPRWNAAKRRRRPLRSTYIFTITARSRRPLRIGLQCQSSSSQSHVDRRRTACSQGRDRGDRRCSATPAWITTPGCAIATIPTRFAYLEAENAYTRGDDETDRGTAGEALRGDARPDQADRSQRAGRSATDISTTRARKKESSTRSTAARRGRSKRPRKFCWMETRRPRARNISASATSP